jgi:hypothetical protein
MAIIVASFWAKPTEPTQAKAPATMAAKRMRLMGWKLRGLLPSTRNLLDRSSVAQRLDGYGRLTGSLRFPVD